MYARYTGFVALAVLAVASLVNYAHAAPADGTNPILDGVNGRLYIPMQPSTSGVLGDPLGGGKSVGLNPDILFIAGSATSVGTVEFLLTFHISEDELPDGQEVSKDSAALLLAFRDLDFVTTLIIGRYEYREFLGLNFLADANDPTPGSPDLVIDGNNYDTFPGPPDFPTNNQEVAYEIKLQSDLGVTDPEFDNINSDREFGIYVWMGVEVKNTSTAAGGLINTPENVENSFQFVGVPEPGALVLLILGGAIGLLRLRRA